MDKTIKIYMLYYQTVTGKNINGYDIYKDKVLNYYCDKEKAERDRQLYLKWNPDNCSVFIKEIEVIE